MHSCLSAGRQVQNVFIDALYSDGYATGANGQRIALFPEGLPRAEGEALYHLVRDTGATRTIEIGMAYGISTLFIAQALSDAGGGDT